MRTSRIYECMHAGSGIVRIQNLHRAADETLTIVSRPGKYVPAKSLAMNPAIMVPMPKKILMWVNSLIKEW